MKSPEELNRRGVELKCLGRYDEAVQCYQSALGMSPEFAEAHYNLGLLWRDVQRVDLAIDCLETTLTLRPDVPLVHFELANLLAAVNDYSTAAEHYRAALDLQPNYALASFNLAVMYLEQSQWQEAESLLRQILRNAPRDADALAGLGTALHRQKKLSQASDTFQQATTVKPDHAVAWTNWGSVKRDQGKLADAIQCYERALAVQPQLAEASMNLGNTWLELGQFDAALVCFRQVAESKPSDPQTFVNLGNVYAQLDRYAEAVQAYQQAIQLRGDCRDAWLNLGNLFRNAGDVKRSQTVFGDLARRSVDQPLHALRAAATCPLVFDDQEHMDAYRGSFAAALREIGTADLRIDFPMLAIEAPECHYNLQFLDGNLCPLKEAFANVYATYFARCGMHRENLQVRSGRPRIGFVVTGRHEGAFLRLIAPLIERLNRERFEPVVLCSRFGVKRIRASMHSDVTVIEFADRFDRVVQTIGDSQCDLLYYWEVGTDPTNYFLPFLRLAPVQVTSWGIQVTSGIASLDAYLSSQLVETPDAQQHYRERLVLSSTLLTFQIPPAIPTQCKSRDAFGFRPDQHLYGCVQNLGKFHVDFDEVLGQILRRDSKGIIVAAQDPNRFAMNLLRQRWKQTMPDVADRIVFLPPLAHDDYVSVLNACDVLLDPTHFGGVTTTYDALALGKPLITLPTAQHRGRYTAACLRKVGVTDTIASDIADYVNLAVDIAGNEDRRVEISRRMHEAKYEAFQDQAAVFEHERIFHELLATVR